jgi:hypothetical protein
VGLLLIRLALLVPAGAEAVISRLGGRSQSFAQAVPPGAASAHPSYENSLTRRSTPLRLRLRLRFQSPSEVRHTASSASS